MISPEHPIEVTNDGALKWVKIPGGGGIAQFFPNTTPTPTPSAVTTPQVNLGTAGAGTANNMINLNASNTSYSSVLAQPIKPPPAPAAPDYTALRAMQNKVQRQKMIKAALKSYDELEASTRATGTQAANNAGTVYSNRLMQAGVNPVASGVVAAQAKLPLYNQLAQINTQKAETRLDATNKADALAAQIASTVANIQLGYSKMLADYNTSNAGYDLDLRKFNASQGQRGIEFGSNQELEREKLAATLAMTGSRTGTGARAGTSATGEKPRSFDPGYIPNSGPVRPAVINGVSQGNRVFGAWPEDWGY